MNMWNIAKPPSMSQTPGNLSLHSRTLSVAIFASHQVTSVFLLTGAASENDEIWEMMIDHWDRKDNTQTIPIHIQLRWTSPRLISIKLFTFKHWVKKKTVHTFINPAKLTTHQSVASFPSSHYIPNIYTHYIPLSTYLYKPVITPSLLKFKPLFFQNSTQSLLREVAEICRVILLAAAVFSLGGGELAHEVVHPVSFIGQVVGVDPC